MKTALVVVLAAALVAAGCGGGDDGDGGTTTGAATRTTATTTTTTPRPQDKPSAGKRKRPAAPPSRRDRGVQQDVARHLDEVARTRSRGEWAAVDIESVTVRGQRVDIETRLRGKRAPDQASSICLAARQGLLGPGAVRTPYDLFVSARGATLAAC